MEPSRQRVVASKDSFPTIQTAQPLNVFDDIGVGCQADIFVDVLQVLHHDERVAHHEVCCRRMRGDEVLLVSLVRKILVQNLRRIYVSDPIADRTRLHAVWQAALRMLCMTGRCCNFPSAMPIA